MVANPTKLLFLGNVNITELVIGNVTIPRTSTVKLLGVTLDEKLNFLSHISDMCTKTNRKIKCFLRIRHDITRGKISLLILAFFNYCPLIWMFSSKTAATTINKTHHRALKTVMMDFTSSYEETLMGFNCYYTWTHATPLLQELKALNIYQLNIFQTLLFMHKVKNDNIPDIFKNSNK